MKRVLMLVGLPVLLGLVWWSGEARRPNATAEITIDTPKVEQLRGVVISRLATVGATKTSEDTAYSGGGTSDLTFEIPPTRLEEALAELGHVGGVVTRQRVELSQLADDSTSLSSDLDGVGGCLTSLSERLGGGANAPTLTEINQCRDQLARTGKQLIATPDAARNAVLNVHISKTSTTSPALIIAVVLLVIALATMIVLTIRSTRNDRVYDITDARTSRPTEDLYHRRN